jgi:NAD-dependent DNA ligase
MTKIKITDLKKELKELDQKDIIQLICDLYKINKDVQHYLSSRFKGEEAVLHLYEETKKNINDEFFPDRGFGKIRLSVAKNVISNFKKLTNDDLKTIDLMLFYVEIGTEFTNTYGDIDSNFYNSMLKMYEKVVDECQKDEELFIKFKDRLYSVVQGSSGIGWGYHDYLVELYYSISYTFDEE